MTSDGYMPLPALLTHMKQRPSEQEVRSVVSCDAKVIDETQVTQKKAMFQRAKCWGPQEAGAHWDDS